MSSTKLLSLLGATAAASGVSIEAAAATASSGVSINGVFEHLQAFQNIADAHGNSRSVQSGYNASAEYVFETVAAARQSDGFPFFDVERQHFDALVSTELASPTLSILGATPAITLEQCEQNTGQQRYYVGPPARKVSHTPDN